MSQHRRSAITVAFIASIALTAGCGGGSRVAPVYGGGSATYTSQSAPAAAPAGEAESLDEAPAPASAGRSASAERMAPPSDAPSPEPRHRPGLGTTWGETRTSHVQHRHFERAASAPFTSLALYYNDAEGIAAQMAYRGGEGISPFYARTPNGGITVGLEGPDGRVLPGRRANGRTYVVGHEGKRYGIVIRNHTGGRYEVVASVDGLDVIDGKPASIGKRGYLLPPYGKLVIDGFRRSDHAVAAFRFGKVKDSYAARTSGARNVGVIGIAFFGERGSEWTTDELHRRETADPFPVDNGYAQPPPAGRVY